MGRLYKTGIIWLERVFQFMQAFNTAAYSLTAAAAASVKSVEANSWTAAGGSAASSSSFVSAVFHSK